MNKQATHFPWMAAALLLLVNGPLRAMGSPSYKLTTSVVAGGGQTSLGGTYVLRGTIGQAEAGVLAAPGYSLIGGVWGVVGPLHEPGAPWLRVTRVAGGVVRISWPYPSTGYRLQWASGFSAPHQWTDVNQTPVMVGGEKTVSEVIGPGERFYRLSKQ